MDEWGYVIPPKPASQLRRRKKPQLLQGDGYDNDNDVDDGDFVDNGSHQEDDDISDAVDAYMSNDEVYLVLFISISSSLQFADCRYIAYKDCSIGTWQTQGSSKSNIKAKEEIKDNTYR